MGSAMTATTGLVAATLVACATGGSSGGAAPAEIPFETVLDEASSGLHEARREAVRDEEAWARLWADTHESVTPQPPLPPVDFSRDMLIAVATGTRPTGGFDIKIRGVALRGERLEVVVHETCPAPGAAVTLALTQPVEIVRLELLPQAPTFQETRSGSCR
jgi:hypothetical protein